MPFGAIAGIINSGLQFKQNQDNLNFQKEQYQYTKEQNDLTRQREDTAIQRRVSDLKNSGLSPVLAAGQGASSSQPIPTSAPRGEAFQLDTKSMSSMVSNLMSTIQSARDITQTQAQTALTQAQVQRSTVETQSAEQGIINLTTQKEKLDAEIKLLGQERGFNYTRNEREKLALEFEKSIGKPTQSQGTIGKAIEDSKSGLRQFFTGFVDGTKNVINQAVDNIKKHQPPPAPRSKEPTRRGSMMIYPF